MPYDYNHGRYIPEFPGDVDPLQRQTTTVEQLQAINRLERERVDAIVAARQKRDQELKAKREAERRERAEREMEKFEETTLQRFLDNGGSKDEFRIVWPSIKEKRLMELATDDPVARAQAEMRASGRYPRMT
jgi:hypothetical protein